MVGAAAFVDELVARLHAPALWSMSWAELLGAASGLVCVWLVARQHAWNWPIGLVNNALFFVLFWRGKLYADALLQLVFAALGVYGWWRWTQHGAHDGGAPARVRTTRRAEWAALAALTALATATVAALLARHSDSPAPLWDASVLTLSLAATYGQAQKLVESWYLWIAVDLLSMPLYVSRALYLTALVYAVFLALCVVGLRGWRAELRGRAERPS